MYVPLYLHNCTYAVSKYKFLMNVIANHPHPHVIATALFNMIRLRPLLPSNVYQHGLKVVAPLLNPTRAISVRLLTICYLHSISRDTRTDSPLRTCSSTIVGDLPGLLFGSVCDGGTLVSTVASILVPSLVNGGFLSKTVAVGYLHSLLLQCISENRSIETLVRVL
jgi:hypothetical protein